MNSKPPDPRRFEIQNENEAIKEGYSKAENHYSYCYLLLDLSLLYLCFCRRKSRVSKYIKEKNEVEEKVDAVELITAIDVLKTSVKNLKNEHVTRSNTFERYNTHGILKEPSREKKHVFRRKNNFISKFLLVKFFFHHISLELSRSQ